MEGFKLTNEQIVYIYIHLSEYIEVIEKRLLRELKMSEKQLAISEEVYGDDPSFNREQFDLYEQLIKYEMPKAIHTRTDFIRYLINVFKPAYELIEETDPEFVQSIRKKLFNESDEINTLLEKIKNTSNGENY